MIDGAWAFIFILCMFFLIGVAVGMFLVWKGRD